MAIAYSAKTRGDNGPGYSSTTCTYAHTCTGANVVLVVGVNGDTSDNITGITYNGNAMTYITKIQQASGLRWQYIYYILIGTGDETAHNVVVTSSANIGITSEAVSYTGAKQSAQPDASGTYTATNAASISTSLTTVADNCWVMMQVAASNGLLANGTYQFLRYISSANTGSGFFDSNGALTPAGSKTVDATSGAGSSYGAVFASFAPYVAASGPANLKSWNGLAKASIKSINGLAIASIKSVDGLA